MASQGPIVKLAVAFIVFAAIIALYMSTERRVEEPPRRGHYAERDPAPSGQNGATDQPRHEIVEPNVPSTYHPVPEATRGSCTPCPEQSYCLFGECFCKPGFAGENCDKPGRNPWAANCPNWKGEPYDAYKDREFACAAGTKWDCLLLCHWQEKAGLVKIPQPLWKTVQENELGVWRGMVEPHDRDDEHRKGFYNFQPLHDSGHRLGNIIEFGSGPFTQTKNVLSERPGLPTVDSITLVDPNADNYIRDVPGCTYKTGKLLGYPTTILSKPGEAIVEGKQYDTVIMMNVIEHVHDAYEVFNNLYDAVRPGGMLIFHERWFDMEYQNPRAAILGSVAAHHPIRVNHPLIARFMDQFEMVLVNSASTPEQYSRAGGNPATVEVGYYVIGRKRKTNADRTCCRKDTNYF